MNVSFHKIWLDCDRGIVGSAGLFLWFTQPTYKESQKMAAKGGKTLPEIVTPKDILTAELQAQEFLIFSLISNFPRGQTWENSDQ